jgi:Domain of Unknown Function (DUF1206)
VAYGVVHLLIAWIALLVAVAWSGTSEQASQQGALQELAENRSAACCCGSSRSGCSRSRSGRHWIACFGVYCLVWSRNAKH